MKTKSNNHSSYMKKADQLFMVQFRGEPCAVCGKTQGTVGHHIVNKARSKALRYDINNIIVLCQGHHMFSGELAPHSTNTLAVARFIDWMRENKRGQMEWCAANERIQRKYTFKDAVENMKEGRKAWDV